MKKSIGKSRLLFGFVVICLFSVALTKFVNADKYVEYFTTYHQNIFTGLKSNYKHYYQWVPDNHYLHYTSHGWSPGGWNYRIQEIYWPWAKA